MAIMAQSPESPSSGLERRVAPEHRNTFSFRMAWQGLGRILTTAGRALDGLGGSTHALQNHNYQQMRVAASEITERLREAQASASAQAAHTPDAGEILTAFFESNPLLRPVEDQEIDEPHVTLGMPYRMVVPIIMPASNHVGPHLLHNRKRAAEACDPLNIAASVVNSMFVEANSVVRHADGQRALSSQDFTNAFWTAAAEQTTAYSLQFDSAAIKNA